MAEANCPRCSKQMDSNNMLNLSLSLAMELFLVKGLILAVLVCTSAAQLLPGDEVEALQTISSKLHNSYWNLSQSSCSNNETSGFNMTCDCSFVNNTVCHVANITLSGLNLNGTLADEFVNLTYLRNINLTRNYLNGTIPTIFGQLGLITLSLLGNRFSGTIPEEIGGIATLEELILDDNLLEGNLPESLGRLRNLRKLCLSANNFNGTIPETYANLRNLTDFRIDGSNLSGRIPEFIGNWTLLERLDLQGTGMEGPIPATISQLKNLTELRISNLGGQSSTFPNLQDMTAMSRLILRNCSITGPIPLYIGSNMTQLSLLDLSFNKLNGEIPTTLNFRKLNIDIFLSHNLLTGEVPGSIPSSGYIDLSYNNFTHSRGVSCQFSSLNLISSQTASASTSKTWCLNPGLPCPRQTNYKSLFINCGGKQIRFEGHEYEENYVDHGPSLFDSNDRWAYSNTGTYMDNDGGKFRAQNDSLMIDSNANIYQTCRVSPSSMKFYGLCLSRGSYTVRLYFAEIMFSDDASFRSLGRRIFDVAIQGQVVLTNFDIAREANGVRRGIYREFNNVVVKGSTLEIHLYWTGKGTTAIPFPGVYGPLISAIAVTPNDSWSVWMIVGGFVSLCVVILLVSVVLRKGGYIFAQDNKLQGLDIQTRYFCLKQIKSATNNFDNANKIGEGGFGIVYRGVLSDGTVIAVKQLSCMSKQGTREFVNEIGMISALNHPNLVKLFGCCVQGNQLLLIYEYLENNCLARAIFGSEEERKKLEWPIRKKICIGIAKGLVHLHEESMLKIVHRDIKATNVLLDKDLNAKISDFGVAKLNEGDNTHISTRVAGTIGYMAPEYALKGHLTAKADVYSFGVVLLEIICGKSNTRYRPKEEEFEHLLDWAYVYQAQGNLLDLVDPCLGSNYPKEEALDMLNISLLCANPCERGRPLMSEVVSMLEGKTKVPEPVLVECESMSKYDIVIRNRAFEALLQDSKSKMSQEQRSVLMDVPWVDSSQDYESLRLCQSLSSDSYFQHFIRDFEFNV